MTRAPVVALVACCSVTPIAFAQKAPSRPPPGLDGYVRQVMQDFEVPGLALAIVKDGRVVLAKGYGVRTLGEPAPVDERTLFGIASNTKAFTATALGILVEEGKIEWDQKVVSVLPWFRLSDPYVTAELTIRDLLVHRSGLGLGAGDLLWWPPSTYDRKEIARRLQFIPLSTSFRTAYAYDNVLYLVAGEVIEAVSGKRWEEFVQTRILDRVGMTGSNVRHSAAEAGGNVATTHARVDGSVRRIKPFDSDNTNPAGGINSNAADMARWMIVQLDSGVVAPGDTLFHPRTARQLWTMVTPMNIGRPAPELAPLMPNFNGYALGFNVRDYRGRKLVTHTGGLPGYVSRVAMIPELDVGVAVLTNMESPAMEPIYLRVLDHYLGAEHDWRGAWKLVTARMDSAMAAEAAEAQAARDSARGPSLPLERYAGTYRDDWYGDITIAREGNGLTMQFGRSPLLVGDLVHWQFDTFLVRWRDRELRADAYVTFSLEPDGSIARARMIPASSSVDFSYDFQDLDLRPVGDPAR